MPTADWEDDENPDLRKPGQRSGYFCPGRKCDHVRRTHQCGIGGCDCTECNDCCTVHNGMEAKATLILPPLALRIEKFFAGLKKI